MQQLSCGIYANKWIAIQLWLMYLWGNSSTIYSTTLLIEHKCLNAIADH